jgi:hypothetical protein
MNNPKKVLGNVRGVKICTRNEFSVPLQKNQFRDLCQAFSQALAGIGDFRPTEADAHTLRKHYKPTYDLLAKLCTSELTREFDGALMHRLRFEQFDLVNGSLRVSFLYSADGIANAEYIFNMHDQLAPYVDSFVKKFEEAGGDKKMRRSYEML